MRNTGIAVVKSDNTSSEKTADLYVFRPDHIDDKALWDLFRGGDEKAFATIFDRSVKPLYNYGMKIVPDKNIVKDATQELFIELWKNHKNLGETDSIRFYLYKCIRRKLNRVMSKQENKVFVSLPSEYMLETSPSLELDWVDGDTLNERKQEVIRMINSLTERQREAVFLRYFEEMEYEKIADVMELTKQAVYNLVNKALLSLRKFSGK